MIEMDWFRRWAQYSPEAIAIHEPEVNKKWSYLRCNDFINKVSRGLSEQWGVKKGDRICVLSNNRAEYILLFFSALKLGAIIVPINFRLAPREIEHILYDSQPRVLVIESEFAEKIKKIKFNYESASVIEFEELTSNSNNTSELNNDIERSFADPCMILYTSGTTGSPKGAVLTPKSIFWNSINTGLRLNLTQKDRTIIFLPLFHTGGWNVLTTPLLHRGGEIILLRKFDAEKVMTLNESEKTTILFGVPTTMNMLAHTQKFKNGDLSKLRYAIVGGEPMPEHLIRLWQEKGVPIRQGYGLTEFGPNVFSLNEEDSIRKIGSIGFPNFYIDVKIVDDKGQELKANQVGELILKGPACMSHYWQNDEATHKTIVNGWLYTGDLVRRDEEGYYYIVGRKKEMFISGGENVYPSEVEKVILELGFVREVAVVGVEDSQWGEVGKAFITLESGFEVNQEEIKKYCLENLAKFKVPKHFKFLSELPKSDSGKVLKRVLLDNYS
ncbi:MAG: long-chain fatty acid--CoA ligase [Bdellovibrionales bacterium]|nr:long-chain fatty acid--CoA ligase [Bdellovibrionales bacterium]